MNSYLRRETTRGAEAAEVRSRQTQTVRVFRSDLLERFTRTRLTTVILFWITVSVGLLLLGASGWRRTGMEMVGIAVAGVAAWTLFEYLLHRFLFHLDRWMPVAGGLCFVMHGCHHADPSDASRDVMPLIGSVPIFGAVLSAAIWSLDEARGFVFVGAFGLAYLAYDVTHYGCHQWRLPGQLGALLKRHHLSHHYVDGARHFGVTSPLWDWIFGTLCVSGRHG